VAEVCDAHAHGGLPRHRNLDDGFPGAKRRCR
jgi:hypothetical protein